MYKIEITERAVKEILKLRKSLPQAYKKYASIIEELKQHPYTGTGHPHQLKHLENVWSRKLDKKNRIRYMIFDDTIIVVVMSVLGHYDDK